MTSTKKNNVFTGLPDERVIDSRTEEEIEAERDAHVGVKTVEAAEKVYGRYSKWFLFLGLGLASYMYSLDSSTTPMYLSFVASSFEEHSLISSIQVAQSVIISAGQPVIAKLADVTSRGTAYPAVLIFYVVGYIVIAAARNLGAVAVGIVLSAIGNTGLQLLTAIIIADTTTLKWRGLVNALMAIPYIINGFVGANITTQVIENSTWRWGYGMFTILIPVSLAPLMFTLFWAERKAKRLGLVEKALARPGEPVPAAQPSASGIRLIWQWMEAFDLIGLVFLEVAVALILVPCTLSSTASHGWHNGSLIAMLVVGIVLLFVFAAWEIWCARRPVVPLRFLTNRTFVGATWMCFFDFMSMYITSTYLYSWVIIVKPWSMVDVGYFNATQQVAMTIFGVVAGAIMRVHRRYKWLCFVGLLIHLLGVGLMIHTRGERSSDAEIVWAQILQGIGAGFSSTSSQVGVQASVPHADVATVTAVVVLWSGIGGACGSAIAGAIWTVIMPGKLAKYLPMVPEADREQLFGSITQVMMYPFGDPVREGVISAYDDVMKIMCIVATCISVLPLFFNVVMRDWYLGDKQNAVDALDLRGELSLDAASVADGEDEKKF